MRRHRSGWTRELAAHLGGKTPRIARLAWTPYFSEIQSERPLASR